MLFSNLSDLHALSFLDLLERRRFLVMERLGPINLDITVKVMPSCIMRGVRLRVNLFFRWR
jgi:hypothetical protein